MRPAVTVLTVLWVFGCGAPAPVAEVEEPLVVEQTPDPLPRPPSCPFGIAAVRAAGTVLNYAIEEQAEASLRVWPEADADATLSLTFRYERRDERGLEVGRERYRCTDAGLLLVAAGPDDAELRFNPPIMVLPRLAEQGQTGGTATLDTAEGTIQVEFVHSFVSQVGVRSPFEGEHIGVASSLSLGAPISQVISTETTWVVGPQLLAAVVRRQSFDDGPTYSEVLRTLVPSR
jgi:hypothetical protein